jgi:uncharacterized protein (DUF1778 family)
MMMDAANDNEWEPEPCILILEQAAWDEVARFLANQPEPNERLRRLMAMVPPWGLGRGVNGAR